MILQYPKSGIIGGTPYEECLRIVATAAGLCYNVTPDQNGYEEFIKKRMVSRHDSVLEHSSVSCYFEVDRGVTHEMVRHRICSFTQSSTRYCDYTGEKEDGNVKFIIPPWCDNVKPGPYTRHSICTETIRPDERAFLSSLLDAEGYYRNLRDLQWRPEQARAVLPNATMARIMWTANLREWRHILNLRAVGTTGRPHPQMSQVMLPLLDEFKQKYPIFFEDL